jgi:hypothetical protein
MEEITSVGQQLDEMLYLELGEYSPGITATARKPSISGRYFNDGKKRRTDNVCGCGAT